MVLFDGSYLQMINDWFMKRAPGKDWNESILDALDDHLELFHEVGVCCRRLSREDLSYKVDIFGGAHGIS